jgi:hypothetical protein
MLAYLKYLMIAADARMNASVQTDGRYYGQIRAGKSPLIAGSIAGLGRHLRSRRIIDI